jgi:hypothetical protein
MRERCLFRPLLRRVDWRSHHSVILPQHSLHIPLVLTGKKYRDTTFPMNTDIRL